MYLYTGTTALFVDNPNNRTQSAGPTSQYTHTHTHTHIIITIHIILYAQYLPIYIYNIRPAYHLYNIMLDMSCIDKPSNESQGFPLRNDLYRYIIL